MSRTKRTPLMEAMKASFSGMKPMRPRTSRAWVRMSRPKMRAVPEAGLWKPSRVLMRVDLPAPFGPSKPMDRPLRLAFRFLRMARWPKRTSSESNSMTGSITLLERSAWRGCSVAHSDLGHGGTVLTGERRQGVGDMRQHVEEVALLGVDYFFHLGHLVSPEAFFGQPLHKFGACIGSAPEGTQLGFVLEELRQPSEKHFHELVCGHGCAVRVPEAGHH